MFKKFLKFNLRGSLVTLELISLIPLVESLEENPLAVKLLDNQLYICRSYFFMPPMLQILVLRG